MTQGDNGKDFNAFSEPLVSGLSQPNIASELIGQDDKIRKLFLTLTHFLDTNEANDFAVCLHKCDKHELTDKTNLFLYMINARVSVKGYRSAQIVDVLTQIQREANARRLEQLDGKRDRGVKTPNI